MTSQPDRTPQVTDSQDARLLERAQALLAGHLPSGATLERSEVNAGLARTDTGYLYLRFTVPAEAPLEFWAHWGTRDHLGSRSGQISVKADREAGEPPAARKPSF